MFKETQEAIKTILDYPEFSDITNNELDILSHFSFQGQVKELDKMHIFKHLHKYIKKV